MPSTDDTNVEPELLVLCIMLYQYYGVPKTLLTAEASMPGNNDR